MARVSAVFYHVRGERGELAESKHVRIGGQQVRIGGQQVRIDGKLALCKLAERAKVERTAGQR